jgi:hypothetical protein
MKRPGRIEETVKTQNPDSFLQRVKLRRANLSGVRRTYVRRSDFEVQRNAESGLLRKWADHGPFPIPE